MKYLNPKADPTFWRVFGKHPNLTISFLNALLPLPPEEEITDMEYLPSERIPETPWRRYSIMDVRCTDKSGRQFRVEIQMIWSPEFTHRVLLNASEACVHPRNSGEQYELPHPVYSLNLVNEVFRPEQEGYYHHYPMIRVENSDKVIDGLQLVVVELPKFTPQTYPEKEMHVLWLRYLTEINERTREVPPELMANPLVRKALATLEESAYTDAQLAGYEKFWDMVSVERTLYASALRKGLEKMRKGREEGKKEARRLIAANMKKQGLSPEIISECTGLSAEMW